MATKSSDEILTPDLLAKLAGQARRKAAEAVARAKVTTDATEKVLLTRSANTHDTLASHFERALGELMNEKPAA